MQKSAILIAVMVAIALGMAGCAQKGKPAAKDVQAAGATEAIAIPVSAVAIAPRDMDERVTVTGTLKPAEEVTVGTRFAGRIKFVIGKEGTRVSKGDVVASLEDQDIRAQLRAADAALDAARARVEQARAAVAQQSTATDTGISSAEAALEAAKARLEQSQAAAAQQSTATTSGITTAQANLSAATARLTQAQTSADATDATVKAQVNAAEAALTSANERLNMLLNGARTQEQLVAKNAVDLAQATYENDRTNFERYQQLYEQKAIAKSVLDGAETKMKISQAQLDSAKQQYALVMEGARQEDIGIARAAVRQAEEGLITAKANLKQIDVAHANVDIARTGVQQAEAALDTAKSAQQVDIMRDKDVLAAKAGVQQAEQGLKAAKAGSQTNLMRKSDLMAALAAEKQAIESRTLAQQNLNDTQIYSPVNGVVAAKMVQVGQSVGGSAAVLKITTDQTLFFEASVSELEATRIRAGQPVQISVDAVQGNRSNLYQANGAQIVTGTVEKVVPVVDARTRNFTVRVVVPKSAELFPGMFARGEIIVLHHNSVVAVPKEAIVSKGGQQSIFTIEGERAKQIFVTTGATDGAYVQVLSGLLPGQRVIIVGQQTLVHEDHVQEQARSTAAPPGAD